MVFTEQFSQNVVGGLTDLQLRKLIQKQDALTDEDYAEGLWAYSEFGWIDDKNEASTEYIFQHGEAARIVLAARQRKRGGKLERDAARTRQQSQDRVLGGLRSLEDSLETIRRAITAKSVGLGSLDPHGRAYATSESEIAELREKQKLLRERRQHIAAMVQSWDNRA